MYVCLCGEGVGWASVVNRSYEIASEICHADSLKPVAHGLLLKLRIE